MDLSEGRATAARLKADKVAVAAAAKVNDLDQEETPEVNSPRYLLHHYLVLNIYNFITHTIYYQL